MKVVTFIALGFFLCFTTLAEDKYAKKSAAWKIWQQFISHVDAMDAKKIKEVVAKDFAEMMFKQGMAKLAENLKKEEMEFVREFTGDDKNKDKKYLVLVDRRQKKITVVIQLKDKVWKIIAFDRADPKGPEDVKDVDVDMKKARARAKLASVQANLKTIGYSYAAYFAEGNSDKIVSPRKTEVAPFLMTYSHPETDKVHKFLFVRGGVYGGSSRQVLAATDVKILGKYYAVYDDGHVASLSDVGFEKYKVAFGIKGNEPQKVDFSKEEQENILAEIKILGAGKYKERQAAKAKLLKRGEGVVYFLKQNLKQDDFEVIVALKEIIKELSPKEFKGRRPEL